MGRDARRLAGGESGNPLSPHYDDMFELWKKGETAKLVWSPGADSCATVAKLELVPNASTVAAATEPVRERRLEVEPAPPT